MAIKPPNPSARETRKRGGQTREKRDLSDQTVKDEGFVRLRRRIFGFALT